MQTWGKGMVWVNGHALGRFWEIGPQQTLYMPGCWLKEGENEIIILDLLSPDKASIKGITKPILDKLNVKKKEINNSYNIDEAPLFYSGKFANRNGWQNIEFPKNMNTRYFALKINSTSTVSADVAHIEITDNTGENKTRKDRKNKNQLAAFHSLKVTNTIMCRYHFSRFDKYRFPTCRFVVDDTFDFSFQSGSNGDNQATVAHCWHHVLVYVAFRLRIAQYTIE